MSSSVLLPGFAGTRLPEWLRDRLAAGLPGVCLFGENIVDSGQLRELTAAITAANPHAVIAIDEEGGDVTRLFAVTGSPYPGNAVLGRLDDPATTARVARDVAVRLADVGVTLNLAPVADVNSNPLNPVIGVRSFGADGESVARHTAAWVAAHEAAGVATCVKHFPGHGAVAVDSHLGLPVLDIDPDLLADRDLAPFRAAIAAGASTVMTSHIVVPRVDPSGPATFSAPILQGLLRQELGFTGVIVSDALDMRGASGEVGIPAAAVRALTAGCDLLCLGTSNTDEQLTHIEAAIAEGVAPARVGDAHRRIEALTRTAKRAEPADHAVPDAHRIAAAFDISPQASVPAGATVVQFQTVANIAVGTVPWGLAAAGVTVTTVSEGDPLPAGPLILVGKDNHRHGWVRDVIDAARATRATIVVEMGWPAPDRAFADVATFGASRAVGAALAGWLGLSPHNPQAQTSPGSAR